MILYGITISPLAEDLREAASDLLAPFYTYYTAFDGTVDCSASFMTLLLDQGTVRGFFPEPSKSLFICAFPTLEEAVKQVFEAYGLSFNVVSGI